MKTLAVLLSFALLSGCAAVGYRPTEADALDVFRLAEADIEEARAAGASTYAVEDLLRAQLALAQAEVYLSEKKYAQAKLQAEAADLLARSILKTSQQSRRDEEINHSRQIAEERRRQQKERQKELKEIEREMRAAEVSLSKSKSAAQKKPAAKKGMGKKKAAPKKKAKKKAPAPKPAAPKPAAETAP